MGELTVVAIGFGGFLVGIIINMIIVAYGYGKLVDRVNSFREDLKTHLKNYRQDFTAITNSLQNHNIRITKLESHANPGEGKKEAK